MRALTRFNPFNELAGFDPWRDLDAPLGIPRMTRWMPEVPAEPTIKLDVAEDAKTYRVKAELPGVRKEDIAVEIDGNEVSLSAEVKRETEKKEGEKVVHTERYYGKQFRSFTLGQDIDRKNAVAKFENGVLELTLPKSGAPAAQRIAVQ